ncbi:malonyl-ACP O-methyltransferase BioC [Aeromonas diversa]|uniref:malonyl-ACP O-methyltransferase BioC n=1 Tax=Aeromonas diversa TaxID=502790 RepID=UPI0039A139FB
MSELKPFQRVDKAQLARRFGAAARHYDAHAAFQREVGEALLGWLPARSERLLDLGCGTGYFLPALAARSHTLTALDLSPGMLARADERHSGAQLVCGDAEALPLGDGSQDLIFSSLALQWCERPEQAFAEARRVLAPGGRLCFSTLLSGSLAELKASYQALDEAPHVNRFLEQGALDAAITAGGLSIARLEVHPWRLYYQGIEALLRDIKGIGASQVNDGQGAAGLGGRARLRQLAQAFETRREPQGLPLTYQVALCVATRVI